jgi:glutamine amidotransferase
VEGEFMYFVHSYHVVPARPEVCVGVSRYGDVEFCSAAASGRVFGCQFHPERSGLPGLGMYAHFASQVATVRQGSVP